MTTWPSTFCGMTILYEITWQNVLQHISQWVRGVQSKKKSHKKLRNLLVEETITRFVLILVGNRHQVTSKTVATNSAKLEPDLTASNILINSQTGSYS